MKTFKQLIAEVAQPNNEDELNFKAKHSIEVIDHPASHEHQHSAEKKSPKRRADYDENEDEEVYEAKKLDPVGKEDDDIDNDGDVDSSDEYLHNRRKAIAKAMKEEIDSKYISKALDAINARITKPGQPPRHPSYDKAPADIKKAVMNLAKMYAKQKNEEVELVEKAVSQAQQQAAGVALAVKRGDKPKSELIGASKEMYKMSEKDLEDFARTSHEGIPARVTESDDFAGWIAVYNGKKLEITKDKAKDLYGAKMYAAKELRVPKSKMGLLAIKTAYNESFDDIYEATPTKKEIARALQNAKAQPKEKVTLKKAPWDEKNEEADKDTEKKGKAFWKFQNMFNKDIASSKKAAEKKESFELSEDVTLDKIRAILTKKNDGTKVVKDKSGYFHIKMKDSHKGPYHTLKDVLSGLEESAFVAKAAASHREGKKKFSLGDKQFPVTIKKSTVDKIMEDDTELTENFKAGAAKLNDGSSVIVKEADAKLMNQLFKELSGANRDAMMKTAMKDKKGFSEILGFAREAL